MERMTEFEKWLILYLTYLESRNLSKKTISTHKWVLSRINAEWGDIVKTDEEELLQMAWERIKTGTTRRKYNQAIKWFKGFQRWWEQEGVREFREWLLYEGYSRETAKEYYYILKASAERINRSEKERKRFKTALSSFRRFIYQTFR